MRAHTPTPAAPTPIRSQVRHPRLLLRWPDGRSGVVPLAGGELLIGRGEDAGLRLDTPSISRHHARVIVGRQYVTIEDLDSRNGTLVNGQKIEQHVIDRKDEIRIGEVSMVLLGGPQQDRSWRGRSLEYIPKATALAAHLNVKDLSSTHTFRAKDLVALLEQDQRIGGAQLISMGDSSRSWRPFDRGLSFGADGDVPLEGWFTGGRVANLAWDGQEHVLIKTAWFTRVRVNGRAVRHCSLRHGDRVQLGDSRFVYRVADQ